VDDKTTYYLDKEVEEMTIDEAIKHAEEVGNGCSECAAEHRQLAEWLRKYQKIAEIVTKWKTDTWTDGVSYDCMVQISEVLEDGNVD
jgi:hypothetical protein